MEIQDQEKWHHVDYMNRFFLSCRTPDAMELEQQEIDGFEVGDLAISQTSCATIMGLLEVNPFLTEIPAKCFDGLPPFRETSLGVPERMNVFPRTHSVANRLNLVGFPKVPPRHVVPYAYKAHRAGLPICEHKKEIVDAIFKYQVVVVKGEPGCGKSTQVPQYILDSATCLQEKVRIICIVPQRIHAVALCDRVAQERGESIGSTVGYQAQLESVVSPLDTLLTYCTSEALVRTLASRNFDVLETTTHIILDELQERDHFTDLLILFLGSSIYQNSRLRLILMTSTSLDEQFLVEYFYGEIHCKVITIKSIPVSIRTLYLDDVLSMTSYQKQVVDNRVHKIDVYKHLFDQILENNYSESGTEKPIFEEVDLRLVASLLYKIHNEEDRSVTVQVFLPEYDELIALKQLILCDEEYQLLKNTFVLCLLHSNTQTGDQKALFHKPQERKIILTTNLADSSITIDDVRIVIDCGKIRDRVYDNGRSTMELQWISKTSADARIGRHPDGCCYRLYLKECYDVMKPNRVPEICKDSLTQLCLFVRSVSSLEISITDVFSKLIRPPPEDHVKCAIASMIELGALDDHEMLTDLGFHLLKLPIEPKLGKALIYSVVFKCVDPVLTIIASISQRGLLLPARRHLEEEHIEYRKQLFAQKKFSDHMEIIKSFQDWENGTGPYQNEHCICCPDHFISSATFELIYGLRTSLLGQLRASGFVRVRGHSDVKDLNTNSNNWALVKAVLFTGLSSNLVKLDGKKSRLVAGNLDGSIGLHPLSTLMLQNVFGSHPAEWIMYDDVVKEGATHFVKGCTVINALSVALFGGNTTCLKPDVFKIPRPLADFCRRASELPACMNQELDEYDYTFKVNDWIGLRGTKNLMELVLTFRAKVNRLIRRKLQKPGSLYTPSEETIVRTLMLVLTCEDHALKLHPGESIGQWPRYAGGNLLSAPRLGY